MQSLVVLAALGQSADLVIENARVITGTSRPARAVAIRDGRILHVGEAVDRYAGPKTRLVDAKGAAVLPGFIDSHCHMAGLGDVLDTFDLRHEKSIADIAAVVAKAASSRPSGAWIRGRAWDQTNWGGTFPHSKPLDAAAPRHPVYLTRVDGHAAWVNQRALQVAGITRETKDPPGGKIIRGENGEPTGVLIDRAQGLVSAKIPQRTADETYRLIERAARECARLGLTTVHDAGVGKAELAAYRRLISERKLPVRVYAMIGGAGPLWREYLDKGPEIGERLTVRSIKLVADGAMGSRGAAFWQPYADEPGNRGLLILQKPDVEAIARKALHRGFQVNTHAIGDLANRTVLDAYRAVLGGKNDKRFRIEHAQVVSLPDFQLFAENSVIASIQSTHATSDMRWAAARLGPDRLLGAWAARRFLAAGVTVANGSDFPVESANPLWGFYAAVTRQDHAGLPPGGFLPEQKLTRDEALHTWTLGGAYAAFEEKEKGTVEPGKLADLVMLSCDPMTAPVRELLTARVLLTIVGGEIVYDGRP